MEITGINANEISGDIWRYDGVSRPAGSTISRHWGNLYGDVVGVRWRLWFFAASNEPINSKDVTQIPFSAYKNI